MPHSASELDSLTGEAVDLQVPSAAERVAGVLREQIVDGQLAPGVRLTEAVVAELLGVSRNTVREALAMLVSERLCERKANRGVFVVVPTLDKVRDLYAYRMLTESAAIVWGAGHSPEALEVLRAAVADARAAAAGQDWFAVSTANQRFHRGLAALSGSTAFARYFAVAVAEMRLAFASAGDPEWQRVYVERNAEVLALLEDGRRDEAASALRAYLAEARDDLLERLARA
jgi:DNA-binding GntR family transcriptional regulator